jgi:hypothetical protein
MEDIGEHKLIENILDSMQMHWRIKDIQQLIFNIE